MRAWLRRLTPLGLAAPLVLASTGCAAGLPEGKPWTVDTAAWVGSDQCPTAPCTLDAYATRDLTVDAVVPAALTDGEVVQVHCWVPTPSVQRDPRGRDAFSWYLLTAGDSLVWAPDLALTSDADLRQDPDDAGSHLSAGVVLCHSAVPGR